MVGEPAAALEQLLPRFEALRSSGAIKLLVIEQSASASPARELPPGCQPFARACISTSSTYGTSEGTSRRVYACRWLGDHSRVEELLTAIEAAGQLLAVPLAKAGLIHPADYLPPRATASRCGWLVAMLAAAEEGHLQADGIAGESWRYWVPGGGIACDSTTVELYRSPAYREAASGDPVALMVAAVDTSARYAIFRNTVESSIALLRHLADMKPTAVKAAKSQRPKKPFHNLTECINHILSTAGGRERILSCRTLTEACDYIRQEFPSQPVSAPGLKASWPKRVAWPWGKKKKKQPGPTVAAASRMGEHFDLDTFQARPSQPPRMSVTPFKCAGCDDAIINADCLQVNGKVYCRECGEEKMWEGASQHLQKSRRPK